VPDTAPQSVTYAAMPPLLLLLLLLLRLLFSGL
jgi:hypothetical protein